jgi:hypothetical protein
MVDVPKIPQDRLRLRPYLAKERFKEELASFIEDWLEMYPGYLSRYDIILRCHALALELEAQENEDRKKRNREANKKAGGSADTK